MANEPRQGAQQQGGGGGAQQSDAKRGPTSPDPRFARPPSKEPGFETRQVCGYDAQGNARDFNLVKGEELPEGYTDAPPAGTHPNQQRSG